MAAIIYRFLEKEEYGKLEGKFEEYGAKLPDPELSAIYAAFDEETIVGFHVLQYVPHAEPMWIAEEYRGKVNWRQFQRGIEGLFDRNAGGSYYIFPADERVANLCRRGGMEELPIRAWKREIK